MSFQIKDRLTETVKEEKSPVHANDWRTKYSVFLDKYNGEEISSSLGCIAKDLYCPRIDMFGAIQHPKMYVNDYVLKSPFAPVSIEEPAINRFTHPREYNSWSALKTRCNNPNSAGYMNYGGRGITVCDRWLESFVHFVEDMGICPEGYSIDRIENDKGYYKENCRWATSTEQNNNKRGVHVVRQVNFKK